MATKTFLEIIRKFNATPQMVFDVFTDPESMKVWWPETTTFDIDLQVGGRWTITRRDGEKEYVATGEYIDIKAPYNLEYTYSMPQFSDTSDIIAIGIRPEGDGESIMTFIEKGNDIAEELSNLPEGAVSDSEKGWQEGFDQMEKFWSKSIRS